MSLLKPPNIDSRTSINIADQTQLLMREYLGWDSSAHGGEAGKALIDIFAHLCSLVVDRINRAPEKNFLAFLDLLGNTLTPATSASVPLSFTLNSSAAEGVLVPSGTRLFAPAPAGATEPVYFETEEDLWLTTLELQSFLSSKDSTSYTDLTALINNSGAPKPLFEESGLTYYFGFALPENRTLPTGLAVVIYFDIESPDYFPASINETTIDTLEWRFNLGDDPTNPTIYGEDHTQQLTNSGKIIFEVPDNFALQTIQTDKADSKTAITNYWLQVKAKNNADNSNPFNSNPVHLKWLAANTVMATQMATVTDEILGSSTGNPGQTVQIFHHPVRTGQRLQVKEREATIGNQPSTQAEWTSWEEVGDFYASIPSDRHYMLNHDSGKVTFGNGQNGKIPPVGVRNIRVTSYQYGGGSQGNVPAGTVTGFWSPINWVEKVTNYGPARGGSDTESYESLLERAPKVLRHRNRAVTESDYEDLAKLASTEVALALCVPLIDLAVDAFKINMITDDNKDEKAGVGKVSLIIVPKTDDTKPTPSQRLIQQVKDYILPRAPSLVSLSVVGPLYLQVNVTLTVHVTSVQLIDYVRKIAHGKITEFLHPLTGRGGQGWTFGREPHASDFYSMLNTVHGIDYVESLDIAVGGTDGSEAILATKRFLICSGEHKIHLSQ